MTGFRKEICSKLLSYKNSVIRSDDCCADRVLTSARSGERRRLDGSGGAEGVVTRGIAFVAQVEVLHI